MDNVKLLQLNYIERTKYFRTNAESEIRTRCWVVTDECIEKFAPLIRALNADAERVQREDCQNWFREVPRKHNGYYGDYASAFDWQDDPDCVQRWFEDTLIKFDPSITGQLIIDFFRNFTQLGADTILGVKVFEVTETKELTI